MKYIIFTWLISLSFIAAGKPAKPRFFTGSWHPYHVYKDTTLYLIFKDLVQKGMEAKSFQRFLVDVVSQNENINNPDLILEGDTILVPYQANSNANSQSSVQESFDDQSASAWAEPSTSAWSGDFAYSNQSASSRSHYFWLVAPLVGYSRIDVKENEDESTSTLLSRINVGVELSLVSKSKKYFDKLSVQIQEHRFETDDDRPFESNKTRVHEWTLERQWRYWKHWAFYTSIGNKETAYLSALDTTRIILDPVSQHFISTGVTLGSRKFDWQSSLKVSYLMSSFASTFRVRHGSSIGLSFRYLSSKNRGFYGTFWGEYRDQHSSVSSQVQKDIGLAAGMQF